MLSLVPGPNFMDVKGLLVPVGVTNRDYSPLDISSLVPVEITNPGLGSFSLGCRSLEGWILLLGYD
jgi:hypothetical protein